jgi:hypothetical protein
MARHGPKPFKAGQRGKGEGEKAELLIREKTPKSKPTTKA